ncbi:response regulator transcription factor [Streptomyces racemochromogenes]|uniref:response regulator transcription factor n=1 Tax=Streptomyces racemochromogenes TaxID=67353 RepID=UPI00338909E4
MTRASRPGAALSDLEATVLRLAAEGHSYPAIGRILGRSTAAVQDSRQRAIIKLGAASSAHAVLIACRAGLIDGRPQRHGDHAGYEAHRRRGEQPCDACRMGERAHRQRQRDAASARQGP